MKKKLLAAVLAATMVMGMSVTAFAAEDEPVEDLGMRKATNDVVANIEDQSSGSTIYSVSVEWIGMEIDLVKRDWDPSTHTSSVATALPLEEITQPTVIVFNDSNAEVRITAGVESADPAFELSLAYDEQGSQSCEEDGDSYKLLSAEGLSIEDTPTVQYKMSMKLSEILAAAADTDEPSIKLGTVTVAIDNYEPA